MFVNMGKGVVLVSDYYKGSGLRRKAPSFLFSVLY